MVGLYGKISSGFPGPFSSSSPLPSSGFFLFPAAFFASFALLFKASVDEVGVVFFPEIHERNRVLFEEYFEVYIEVPMETLYRRDNKNLYERALNGDEKNVVGIDIPFTPPAAPDRVIDNRTDRDDLQPVALEVLEQALAG